MMTEGLSAITADSGEDSLRCGSRVLLILTRTVLKGMNLQKKGTTILRNGQIGGHRAGDEEPGR